MPNPEEIAAANLATAQQQKDAAAVAEATHLLKVKLDLEEMSDEAEIEIQTLKLKQIELANQAKMKRRAILKKGAVCSDEKVRPSSLCAKQREC